MPKTKLLIFPLDLDGVIPVIRIATALGIEIIGASSAMPNQGDRTVEHFVHLPYITDPNFDAALRVVLHKYEITTIFAPHQAVWRHLNSLLGLTPDAFHFKLCRPDPFSATAQCFSLHESWATSAMLSTTAEWIGGQTPLPPLSRSCYSGLHRQYLDTPGDSDECKLLALCDIMRLLPPGNLLEVGSLYGRSAFALGYLCGHHRIGNLICVDPWNVTDLSNQGAQAALLNAERFHIDFELVFRIFLSSVALLNNVGYIRKTSEEAIALYEAALLDGFLESAELSRITLSHHLSLLHIDGNHRYDYVRKDVETWSPYLAPGGWLLLDDYVWAFGDGPRRVGDELLDSPLYDNAFVNGDTLFLRRCLVS